MEDLLTDIFERLNDLFTNQAFEIALNLEIFTNSELKGIKLDEKLSFIVNYILEHSDYTHPAFTLEELDWMVNFNSYLADLKSHIKTHFKAKVNIQDSPFDFSWVSSYESQDIDKSNAKKYPKTYTSWLSIYKSLCEKLQDWDDRAIAEPGTISPLSQRELVDKIVDHFKDPFTDYSDILEWIVDSEHLTEKLFDYAFMEKIITKEEHIEALDGFYTASLPLTAKCDNNPLSKHCKKNLKKYVEIRAKLVALATEIKESALQLSSTEAVEVLKSIKDSKHKLAGQAAATVDEYEECWTLLEEDVFDQDETLLEEVRQNESMQLTSKILDHLTETKIVPKFLYIENTPLKLKALSSTINNFLKMRKLWNSSSDKLSLLYSYLPEVVYACFNLDIEASYPFGSILSDNLLFKFITLANPALYAYYPMTSQITPEEITVIFEKFKEESKDHKTISKFMNGGSAKKMSDKIIKYKIKANRIIPRISTFWTGTHQPEELIVFDALKPMS